MKHIDLRPKAALLSAAAIVSTAIVAATPTMALAAGVDDLGLTPHINGFLGILSGPIARLVCAILIIVGVILFSRGHDMGESVKTIGTIALGVAALIVVANVTTTIQGTGAMIPDLPNQVAAAAHHIALRAK